MTRIKDLNVRELPRERLAKYGPEKLHDYELLAILLGSGVKGLNVLALSKQILKKVREVGVDSITHKDLASMHGLGASKAAQVIALITLGRRLAAGEAAELLSPKDIWQHCSDFRASKREHFVAFYLDTQNRLIERRVISIGTLSTSLVHPREVFEPALRNTAASLIVAHNHPSGALDPSPEDIDVTLRLKQVGEIIGIPLMDHVIVSEQGHKSIFAGNTSWVSGV